MGLAYALIIVGVIFLDLCVRQEKYTLKNLARQVPSALVLALPVLVSFLGWSRYVALAASIDKNSVGSAGVSRSITRPDSTWASVGKRNQPPGLSYSLPDLLSQVA